MVVVAGCVNTPLPATESRSQQIGTGDDEPPDPEPVCVDTPGCSLTYLGGYQLPLQSQLRCSQTYRYWSGYSAGFLGGIGFFCPDIPSNRTLFRHWAAFLHDYCDTCITIPPAKMFVFSTLFVGPDCPSGCIPGDPPSPL